MPSEAIYEETLNYYETQRRFMILRFVNYFVASFSVALFVGVMYLVYVLTVPYLNGSNQPKELPTSIS